MQIERPTIMEKNEQIAPVLQVMNQSRQTFDLPELIIDFCSWYKGCLADRNQQLHSSISTDIPRYVQGKRLFMKHLLFEVGKCSLLHTGAGVVSVQIDAAQHTSRRHSLSCTISIAGTRIPLAREKELFQPGPREGQRDACSFRSANLYYAQMMAGIFGGDIHIDNSADSGLRFLVGINIFTRPS